MSFCTNCGAKLNVGVKFCPTCGQSTNSGAMEPLAQQNQNEEKNQLNQANTETEIVKKNISSAEEPKKSILNNSNTYFSCFFISLLLMRQQTEGGWNSFIAEVGKSTAGFFLLAYLLYVAVVFFTVRIQGINKNKPAWILGTLCFEGALTVFGIFVCLADDSYARYNWANWASELIGFLQLFLLYSIYKSIKLDADKQNLI